MKWWLRGFQIDTSSYSLFYCCVHAEHNIVNKLWLSDEYWGVWTCIYICMWSHMVHNYVFQVNNIHCIYITKIKIIKNTETGIQLWEKVCISFVLTSWITIINKEKDFAHGEHRMP